MDEGKREKLGRAKSRSGDPSSTTIFGRNWITREVDANKFLEGERTVSMETPHVCERQEEDEGRKSLSWQRRSEQSSPVREAYQ